MSDGPSSADGVGLPGSLAVCRFHSRWISYFPVSPVLSTTVRFRLFERKVVSASATLIPTASIVLFNHRLIPLLIAPQKGLSPGLNRGVMRAPSNGVQLPSSECRILGPPFATVSR